MSTWRKGIAAWPWRWVEVFVLGMLIWAAVVHAAGKMGEDWQRRTFYQYEFGPAVMVACGRGFSGLPAEGVAKSFLELHQQTLDCSELAVNDADIALTPFQGAHRYLIAMVGRAWQVLGIDWAVADLIALGLFALTCLMAYVLLRQFLPVTWSIAGLFLFATSTTHLYMLESMRDYAKAPFVLGVLAGLAFLLKARRTGRVEVATALLIGVGLGAGLGMRLDLLVFMPFAAGMLIAFYPAPLGQAWLSRLRTASIVLVAAYACAYPVLASVAKGSNTAHVILLGLSQQFDEALGLYASDHELAPFYNDAYQLAQVDAYAETHGEAEHLQLASPGQERWGYGLLARYVTLFPADIWLRGVAAVVEGIGYDFGLRVRGLQGSVSLIVVALVVVGAWRRSRKLGLAMAAGIAFLFVYPVLQFNVRHFFFAAIVPIGCALLVARAVFGFACDKYWRRAPMDALRKLSPWSFGCAVAAVVLVPSVVWGGLWMVQSQRQAGALRHALEIPVTWASLIRPSTVDSGPWRLTSEQFDIPGRQPGFVDPRGKDGRVRQAYYLVFDIDPARPGCDVDHFRGALDYQASAPFYDFGRTFSYFVHERTRIFVPALEMNDDDLRIDAERTRAVSRLNAIEIESRYRNCLQQVGVAGPTKDFPLLMDFAVPLDRPGIALAAKRPYGLVDALPPSLTIATLPPEMTVPSGHLPPLAEGWRPLKLEATSLQDAGVQLNPDGHLRIDVSTRKRYSYLVLSDEIEIQPGESLVVAGTLYKGGLTVGLLKNETWEHQSQVLRPGDFDIYLAPPPGTYRLVLANNLPRGRINRLNVDRLGVLSKFGDTRAEVQPRSAPLTRPNAPLGG